LIILEIELVCCNYVDAYGREVHETVIIKNHDLVAALKNDGGFSRRQAGDKYCQEGNRRIDPMPKKEFRCPDCERKFKANKRGRKDLQHHLWGKHNIEVIKSHEIAEQAVAVIAPLVKEFGLTA